MNPATLSPEMRRAFDYAKKHGGTLKRLPGGFWVSEAGGISYGTTTIRALVARGVASYSEWKKGANGEFPIAVTIIETTTKNETIDSTPAEAGHPTNR